MEIEEWTLSKAKVGSKYFTIQKILTSGGILWSLFTTKDFIPPERIDLFSHFCKSLKTFEQKMLLFLTTGENVRYLAYQLRSLKSEELQELGIEIPLDASNQRILDQSHIDKFAKIIVFDLLTRGIQYGLFCRTRCFVIQSDLLPTLKIKSTMLISFLKECFGTKFFLRNVGRFLAIFIYKYSTDHKISGYLTYKFSPVSKNRLEHMIENKPEHLAGLNEILENVPSLPVAVRRALSFHKSMINNKSKRKN